MEKVNVAIGRLYGSSGRRIAEFLAKELEVRLYDRQIICLMAEKLGLESTDFSDIQRLLDSYNYQDSRIIGPYSYMTPGSAKDYSDVQMFVEQSKIITKLAKSDPGIFLGRCANVILKDLPHTYSFFLYADDEYREKEIKKDYGETSLKALKKKDKQRDEYYKRFTGFKRDDPSQYDFVVNVGRLGIEETVKLIKSYVEGREE